MKSLDVIRNEFAEGFKNALDSNDGNKMADVFADYAESVRSDLMASYTEYQKTQDSAILASRGIKQLTSEEKKFWEAYSNAVKTGDIKNSFTGIAYTYPESFLVEVLNGIKDQFELVDAVDAVDTTILTKILVNNQAAQLASWAAIGSAITTELNANVSEIDLTACKLSAFIPVSMDMIQAGAEFIAAYVMRILIEAVGCGLEKAILSGTGYNQPSGMDRDLSSFTPGTGYSQKEATALTDLSPATVGSLFASFAVDGNGRERNVEELLFVCSPATYYGKVYPAIYDPMFNEVRTALPFRFIKSTQVSSNKAIIGVAKNYKLGICFGGKSGALEFSDEAKFLDDVRVYKSKILANGTPIDNTSFGYYNIANLHPRTILTEEANF